MGIINHPGCYFVSLERWTPEQLSLAQWFRPLKMTGQISRTCARGASQASAKSQVFPPITSVALSHNLNISYLGTSSVFREDTSPLYPHLA